MINTIQRPQLTNWQLLHQDSGNTEYYTPRPFPQLMHAVHGGIDLDVASSEIANRGDGVNFGVEAFEIFTQPSVMAVEYDQPDGLPTKFFGKSGWEQQWHGRVWMNHPFGHDERPCRKPYVNRKGELVGCGKKRCEKRGWHAGTFIGGNETWVRTAVEKYQRCEVEAVMLICYAAVNAGWFRPLLDYPILFPSGGRVNYFQVMPDGSVEEKQGNTKDSVVVYLGRHVASFVREASRLGTVKI